MRRFKQELRKEEFEKILGKQQKRLHISIGAKSFIEGFFR